MLITTTKEVVFSVFVCLSTCQQNYTTTNEQCFHARRRGHGSLTFEGHLDKVVNPGTFFFLLMLQMKGKKRNWKVSSLVLFGLWGTLSLTWVRLEESITWTDRVMFCTDADEHNTSAYFCNMIRILLNRLKLTEE